MVAPSKKATPEAIPREAYFDALLDDLDKILGSSTKILEREQLKDEQLSIFTAHHNLLVSSFI